MEYVGCNRGNRVGSSSGSLIIHGEEGFIRTLEPPPSPAASEL